MFLKFIKLLLLTRFVFCLCSFWDFADIVNAETIAQRSSSQRSKSTQQQQQRRSSIFGKKVLIESNEDKIATISSNFRVKLDKNSNSSVTISKLNSLAYSMHNYFASSYFICGKTNSFAIVRSNNNNNMNTSQNFHANDSEKQSTASATVEKSHLLEFLYEVNVTSLLVSLNSLFGIVICFILII